jgi:magnesium transporter
MLVTVSQDGVPAFATFKRRFLTADPEDIALGIDYMLYELLDSFADDWTPRISTFSNTLDTLEFQVFDPTTRYDNLLEGLHELKRKLRESTKSIESLHTITMRMLQPGERLINDNVKRYFTDLHQLTAALVKRVSNYSAGATSTRDTYLSSINLQLSQSNAKLTEVMTTLTMVGAIMLPLTLIAGIFGMNNEDLPSDVFGGFWGIMAMMAAFAVMMLAYFWRRGWLGPSQP